MGWIALTAVLALTVLVLGLSLLSLRRSVEGGALAQAESEISQLRSLVLKRDYSRGDGTDAAAELAELQAQRKSLAAQGANSVRTLTAPKSGIYSAVVDGYETVLTPESLDTLTPSALSALTADSAVSSNVGKLITSDRWYYAAALPDDDAADLTEGQSVTLRFSKGAADDLPAEVWRVGESENGRTLVILSGREYLAELTLLRHQSASIILKTTEGIRVPQTALRVDTVTTTGENGDEITTRTTGVYTVVGRVARFKPVTVVYTGDGFSLVRAAAEKESLRLRPGEEIILTAKELSDGAVVR